jgi:hypothetical protein
MQICQSRERQCKGERSEHGQKKLYYASHTDATDYIGGSSCPIANREEVRQNLMEMFFYISKKGKNKLWYSFVSA